MKDVLLGTSDTVIVRVAEVHSLHTTKVSNLLLRRLVQECHNIEKDVAFSCNTSVKGWEATVSKLLQLAPGPAKLAFALPADKVIQKECNPLVCNDQVATLACNDQVATLTNAKLWLYANGIQVCLQLFPCIPVTRLQVLGCSPLLPTVPYELPFLVTYDAAFRGLDRAVLGATRGANCS